MPTQIVPAATVVEKATGISYDQFTGSVNVGTNAIDLSKHTKLYINKETSFHSCITIEYDHFCRLR